MRKYTKIVYTKKVSTSKVINGGLSPLPLFFLPPSPLLTLEMTTASRLSLTLLYSLCYSSRVRGFQSNLCFLRRAHRRSKSTPRLHLQSDPDDETDSAQVQDNNKLQAKDDTTRELDIDAILDTPIFDPDKSDDWFSNLVKNDYNTAEALYAGVIIAMGVVASQEALRAVKYGSSYVPFHGSGGQLF